MICNTVENVILYPDTPPGGAWE